MNIQAVNNQKFQSKFKIAEMSLTRPVGDKIATITRYKVYDNPLAKDIFERAKTIKAPSAKEELLSQMGYYEFQEETTYIDKILPSIREAFCKKRPE